MGKWWLTVPTREVDPDELINLIAGRRLAEELHRPVKPSEAQVRTEALRLEGVSAAGKLRGY